MSNFNNNYVGNMNGGGVYLDTREPADDALLNLAASMGHEVGAGIPAIAGNVIGNAVNYGFNSMLQDKQMRNQLELQRRATRANADAVRNQARLQVEGMKAAGLNPAGVNGSGAPSVQSGAAAGATSSMTNVFSGLAELVTALKAPTEIEKMQAETALGHAQIEKTQAETDLTHEQKYNLMLDSDLIKPEQAAELHERVREAKNANEMYEAYRDFTRDVGPGIFDGYRGMLKAAGIYDKLPERTRQTIDSLADGEIDLGPGQIQGLNDIVNSQANLSQRDRQLFENFIGTVTAMNQANNKKVMEAYENLPENERRLMDAEIRNLKASAGKMSAETWLMNHTSDEYLIEHGLEEEFKRRRYKDIINGIYGMANPQTYTNMIGAYIGGRAFGSGVRGAGRAAGKVTPSASKPSASKSAPKPNPVDDYRINPATDMPYKSNNPMRQSQSELNKIHDRERAMRNGKNFR